MAHSYRKRPWGRSCGPTASDLNYLDTRLDGQIEGTNGPRLQSRALSFPPWLLLSMLQLGILPCAVQDMYLSLVCGWAPLSLECNLDIAFHWAFRQGVKRDNGRVRCLWTGPLHSSWSYHAPRKPPPADTESWELMSHNENSYETHKQYLHSYL